MSHPNIVTVLTAEKQDGVFFIVMEYVAGETLETIIMREGALELTRALDFSVPDCQCRRSCACSNVIHRDLRPGNMLILGQVSSRWPTSARRASSKSLRTARRYRQPAVHGAQSSFTARRSSRPTSIRSA